jgi:lipoyl(octanoyl) transferase
LKRDDITPRMWRDDPILWDASTDLVNYPDAISRMEKDVASIRAGLSPQRVWLLEHPPVYTSGTSAKTTDLLAAQFPVYQTGRGGQFTYHGPGQRIAYVMLDISARGNDVRGFVSALESWIIATLGEFGIKGERREDRVGVWVADGKVENKIAALGIRISRGISFHGISINVSPDLSHYDGIIACGVREHGVTSFKQLGLPATMAELDQAMLKTFQPIFGPVGVK